MMIAMQPVDKAIQKTGLEGLKHPYSYPFDFFKDGMISVSCLGDESHRSIRNR